MFCNLGSWSITEPLLNCLHWESLGSIALRSWTRPELGSRQPTFHNTPLFLHCIIHKASASHRDTRVYIVLRTCHALSILLVSKAMRLYWQISSGSVDTCHTNLTKSSISGIHTKAWKITDSQKLCTHTHYDKGGGAEISNLCEWQEANFSPKQQSPRFSSWP